MFLALAVPAVIGVPVLVLQAGKLKAKLLARFPTIRERFFLGLCVVGVIPAFAIPVIIAAGSAGAVQTELAAQLDAAVQPIAGNFENQVERQIERLDQFAAQISAQNQMGASSLGKWLQHFHDMNPELVTMLVADADGRILAASALADDQVREWNGPLAGVSDREYFRKPLQTGLKFVSRVTKGPAPRFDAMLDISVPLVDRQGTVRGILQGRLNLRKLHGALQADESSSGSFTALTDENGRVILASDGLWFRGYEDLADHPMVAAVLGDQATDAFSFSGLIEQGEGSGRYLAAHRQLDNGWRVFRIQSLAVVDSGLLFQLGLVVVWTLAALWMSTRLAAMLSSTVSDPLRKLDESLDNFYSEPTMRFIADVPAEAPDEIQAVFGKVRRSLERSRESYRAMLNSVNEEQELRQVMRSLSGRRGASKGANETAGQQVESFEKVFAETWELCSAESRPLSLLLLGIGDPAATGPADDPEVPEELLEAVALIMKDCAKRAIDFTGRSGDRELAILLPETDLEAALVVAERARAAAQMALASICPGQSLVANVGAGTIVPNAKGDVLAFLRLTRRVLVTACQLGSSRVAHLNGKGKVSVLKASPDSPPMAQQKLSA